MPSTAVTISLRDYVMKGLPTLRTRTGLLGYSANEWRSTHRAPFVGDGNGKPFLPTAITALRWSARASGNLHSLATHNT